jgi:predicted RNA-binding Zn ribbon-like protein
MTAPQHTPSAPAPTVGHAHVADLEACLDLINTLELDRDPQEHLLTPDDGIAYFTTRGLAHEEALRAQAGDRDDAWLDRVRDVRAALREVWDAAVEGRTVRPDAVATLNGVLAHTPHAELHAALAGVVVGHRHDADPTGEALARVTAPLVAAIEAGETARFRICANDDCRWAFEDTSRGGRRRWCDMSSCGNQAKVRRFRSKRAAGGADGAPESGPGSEAG